jgi:hypothetical protein
MFLAKAVVLGTLLFLPACSASRERLQNDSQRIPRSMCLRPCGQLTLLDDDQHIVSMSMGRFFADL